MPLEEPRHAVYSFHTNYFR